VPHINGYIYFANKAYFYCAIAISTRLSGDKINYSSCELIQIYFCKGFSHVEMAMSSAGKTKG
jgi:hypothetical protein